MPENITVEQFTDLAEKAVEAKRPTMGLFQDEDGNWRGAMEKGGKFITVRDVGPETVVQLLLTHD